jgi:hypothetical protein
LRWSRWSRYREPFGFCLLAVGSWAVVRSFVVCVLCVSLTKVRCVQESKQREKREAQREERVQERLALLRKELVVWEREQETKRDPSGRSGGRGGSSSSSGTLSKSSSSSNLLREQLEREREALAQAEKVRRS